MDRNRSHTPIAQDLQAPTAVLSEPDVRRGPCAAELFSALLATGATLGDAMGAVADALGADAAKAVFDRETAKFRRSDRVLAVLDDVAHTAPEAANAWLGACLASGKIQQWDLDGVNWGLYLGGRPWVTSLPDGLKVLDDLDLHDCTALKSLPRGLDVCGLSLRGCTAWDGRIPDDAVIHGLISIDFNAHRSQTLTLEAWRVKYPDGFPRKAAKP